MDSGPLKGRVALVTGASRGIGAAVAARLARDGATVAVNYLKSEAAAAAVVDAIAAGGGTAKAFRADMQSAAQAKALVQAVVEAFGTIDILVNNVGNTAIAPLEAIDEELVRIIVLGNIQGTIFATQAAAPHLAQASGGGRIVNVSAIASHHSIPGVAVYAAAKAGVNALTRTFALELASKGIRVNAVAPGPVDTEMFGAFPLDEASRQFLLARHPFGRIGRAEDIADAIAFLASPDARWITGQVIDTAGGFLP